MLLLSRSFLEAVTKLPADKLKRIPKFVEMLHANRSAPSLNFERVQGTDLFSARLDLDYRGILAEHPQGHLLLHVDKHDDAYRWGERWSSASASLAAYPYAPASMTTSDRAEEQRERRRPARKVDGKSQARGPSSEPLLLGSIHTWAALQARFDWDTDKPGHYLREKDGAIVCACLRADKNPNAPWEILVGKKPENLRQANLLAKATQPIPVFVKEAVNQWEYWGEFVFDRRETDAKKMGPRLPPSRRSDTELIVFLRSAE